LLDDVVVRDPKITNGFVGRPPDAEAVRRDFDDFVTGLESSPSEKVRVVFGFAWGNEVYEHDWLEMGWAVYPCADTWHPVAADGPLRSPPLNRSVS
jgi:hypothetical protein